MGVNRLRRVALSAWVFLLWITGRLRKAKRQMLESNAVVVLLLHRVLDKDSARSACSAPELITRQNTFERMVRYIVSEFEPVDLSSAISGDAATRPRLAVTFDGGWQDNYAVAFPLARSAQLKFTVFVCPQFMGKTLPFWRERVVAGMRAKEPRIPMHRIATVIERLKALPASERDSYIARLPSRTANHLDATIDWVEASEMQPAGVSFGSHTSTHQMLTRIPPTEARREIFDSRAAVRTRLGQVCDLFAYPGGDVSAKVRDLVKEAGYRLAFSSQPGFWTAGTDVLQIPRVCVFEEKVTSFTGRFSRSMFDYSLIFRTRRSVRP